MKKVLALSFSGLAVILGNLLQYWLVARTIQSILESPSEVPGLLGLLTLTAALKAPFSFYCKARIPAASQKERLETREALLSKVLGVGYRGPAFLRGKKKPAEGAAFQAGAEKNQNPAPAQAADSAGSGQNHEPASGINPVDLMTEGVESLELYRGLYLPQFILGMVSPLAVCAGIALVDLTSALILLLFVPTVPILTNVLRSAFKKASEKYRQETAQLSARFQEGILGLRTLKLFGASKAWGDRVKEGAEGHRKASMKLLATNQLMILWTDLSFTITTLGVALFLAVSRYQEGAVGFGAALFLVLASIELSRPLQLMGAFFFAGGLAKASMKKIAAFLGDDGRARAGEGDEVSEAERDRADGKPSGSPASVSVSADRLQEASGESSIANPADGEARSPGSDNAKEAPRRHPERPNWKERPDGGRLVVRNLSYAYPDARDRDAPVFGDLNLDLEVGQALGLAGPSGIGKTTLAKILQGLLQAGGGTIEWRGPWGELDAGADPRLRQQLCATATQSPYLFSGTLAYNLRIAAPRASDEELLAALDTAGLGDFVRAEKTGLDREIGEEGRRLSGGQRSRLSLARAILKRSPVLILDEPSADLDRETEEKIAEALGRLKKDRAILVISHRPALFSACDRVIHFEALALASVSGDLK